MSAVLEISQRLKDFYTDDLRNLQAERDFLVERIIHDAVAVVWRLPGAIKYRCASGSTYIRKLWYTADAGQGEGNKCRRRQGYIPQYQGNNAWRWVKPRRRRQSA